MHLTKPLDIAPADQSTSEIEKRLMDVVWALVADLQSPEAVHPRQRPLHHPPVPAQLLAGLYAPASDTRGYASLPECLAACNFLGRLRGRPRGLRIGRDGIHGILQRLGVMDVSRRVDHRERDSLPVANNMALRALLALIRRIRSGLLAPRERPHSPSP